MAERFDGRVGVITGSSRGIGRALARALAERGMTVVLNGRDPETLARTERALLEAGCRVLAVPGDVAALEDCRRLIDTAVSRCGRLDLLVNNAGLSARGKFEDSDPGVFRRLTDVNILGAVNTTWCALPHLRRSRGQVIFVSSLAGLVGLPGGAAYSATKMGLTALAESLRVELAGSGVHVGIIYPGFTENEEEKRILSPEGSWIPIADPFPVQHRREEVVRHFVTMIEKRRFKQVCTPLDRFIRFVQLFAPRLIVRFLTRRQRQMGFLRSG
jgi:NAD(P)-dependent dehydrogenase (short-subunit alcohol dehydrogenase family)